MRNAFLLCVLTLSACGAAPKDVSLPRQVPRGAECPDGEVCVPFSVDTNAPLKAVLTDVNGQPLKLSSDTPSPPAPDGKTPETAVEAGPLTRRSVYEPLPPHRNLLKAVQWWRVDRPTGSRCYISASIKDGDSPLFVTVPEDWCEGMR